MPTEGDILNHRYQILRVLSDKGGMGVIYQATDLSFNNTVVIKHSRFTEQFLKQQYSAMPPEELRSHAAYLRKAFEREARLVRGLKHDALPSVIDYFTTSDGHQFFVMDFIPGKDFGELLDERLRKNQGPFPLDQVLDWADQLLDALDYLHTRFESPIIHRDLKPLNLKLTPDGQIVLLDFGLAKGATLGMSIVSASIHGYTLQYAPLEQIRGKGTSVRSDLYSLAVTLHHLLTGTAPPSAVDRVTDTTSGEADPLRLLHESNSQIPAAISEVIRRAAALNPNERHATAAEMRRALRQSSKPAAPTIIDPAPTEPPTIIRQERTRPETLSPTPDLLEELMTDADHYLIPHSPLYNSLRPSRKVLGIDLGTTKSVISISENGKPMLIANAEGLRTIPSVIAYTKSGDCLVGRAAKKQIAINPENSFYSLNRIIGLKYVEIAERVKQLCYKVLPDSVGNTKLACPIMGKRFTPEQVLAQLLHKLIEDASKHLGEKVTQAVITCPAHFSYSQYQAIKNASQIAGLEVLRIIPSTSSAALAYGLGKSKDQTIAILDFGGSTLDASIFEFSEGVMEVKAVGSHADLGGEIIDQRIVEWVIEEFKKNQGIDLSKDMVALQRLRAAAEEAKIELSSMMETEINLPFVIADQSVWKHLQMKLTRTKFEALVDDILRQTLQLWPNVLKGAGIAANQVDEVVLVGGSTRIPKLKQMVKEFFGIEPNKSVNPDEVVASGAAVQAGILSGDIRDLLLLDVTPVSLGIETLGGVFTVMIERNSTLPTRKSEVFTTTVDNQTSMDFHVLEGERRLAEQNKSLAIFCLDGIAPAPRGVPQIEVTFDIGNSKAELSVSAKNLLSGKEQRVIVSTAPIQSKQDIEGIFSKKGKMLPAVVE